VATITKAEARKLGIRESKLCRYHENHPDQNATMNGCRECILIRDPCGCGEDEGCELCCPEDFIIESKVERRNKMDEVEKKWIEGVLQQLDFVLWDRVIYSSEYGIVSVYGWIDREKDSYKDFVILEFDVLPSKNPGEVYFLGTSSSEHSKKIAGILGSQHQDCERVEVLFNITNKVASGSTKKDGEPK